MPKSPTKRDQYLKLAIPIADKKPMTKRRLHLSLLLTLSMTAIFPLQLLGDANSTEGATYQLYQETLDRHLDHGHIDSADIHKQKFQIEKDKEWGPHFKNQVRGVASSLDGPKKVFKFVNPEIEISID